jgi:glyoxylase-like metal-dependent hydrolase (beta-lactamase superfamily II)
MRLTPLHIGEIDMHMGAITGEEATRRFPVPAWLIEHPDGLVLFDTGMHIDLQTSFDRIGLETAKRITPDFSAGQEITARLAARGLQPSDIDRIVLSHLHFDHCGGNEEIPDARVIVQEAEWKSGQDQRLIDYGVYNPADYDHGHDIQQIVGEHDVFGDGRLVCLPTPGHTRGHQSLRVELDSGPVILTGDCVYLETMLDDMIVPTTGSERAQALQLDSMRFLADQRQQGCRLFFGHDLDQINAIPAEGLT